MNGNSEKITRVLELLTEGLAPYVEGKLRAIYRENWQRVQGSFRDDRTRATRKDIEWDAASLLTVMWDQWNSVFRHDLGHYERSLVSELREFRNRWAHQQAFDFDDTYRVTDSIRRLLQSVNAANLEAVRLEKSELIESHVAEAVNSQVQRTAYNRNKWWIIGIYSICCVLILGFLVANNDNGPGNYFIMTTVLLAFVYMIYQQFKMEPPRCSTGRECHRCHRIVYRQSCPYCEGA